MLMLSVVVELVEGDVGPRGRPARLLQPLSHHPRRNAVRILQNMMAFLMRALQICMPAPTWTRREMSRKLMSFDLT